MAMSMPTPTPTPKPSPPSEGDDNVPTQQPLTNMTGGGGDDGDGGGGGGDGGIESAAPQTGHQKWAHADTLSCPRGELNSRPLVYKTSALTTELRRPTHCTTPPHIHTSTHFHPPTSQPNRRPPALPTDRPPPRHAYIPTASTAHPLAITAYAEGSII